MGSCCSCFGSSAARANSPDSEDEDRFDPRKKGYNPYAVEIAAMGGDKGPAPSSNILLPLYIYPHPEAWDPILQTIAKYPGVSFTVVINPFNGPGVDKLPDANYQQEIPKLTAHSNVRVVGYVHTTWARRDLGLVCADVSRYAAWPEHSGDPGLRVDGIFVDETPNIYDSDAEVYLSKLRDHVKAMPGGENHPIIHNPGSVPDVAFLKLADSTVIFEDTYHTFQTRVSNHVFAANALTHVDRSKLACVIHSIPEDLTVDDWRAFSQQARRIAGDVFMTDLVEHYYANIAPRWLDFVESIAC